MIRNSVRQSIRTASRVRVAGTAQRATFAATARFVSSRATNAPLARPTLSKLNPLQVRFYAETVKVPDMAESITEGTLRSFEKEIGDFVSQDEEIATIETDKIDVSVNAPISGTITEFLANPEDTVVVGQPLLKIEPGEGGAAAAAPKEEAPKEEAPKKEEAPAKAEEPKKEAPKPKKEEPKKEAAGAVPFARGENRVKMNRMRLRIAERLKESQNTAASLTTFQEVDMSAVMEMRKLYKDEMLKKTGTKLGFMGLFSRACVLAMKEVPAVNAAIEGPNGGDTIVYRDYVDISVAVATPKGLVTPVVRNAESLDVMGIEKEIHDLGVKARDSKLTLEDMSGGTFTISNGGVFGSLYGTPIINLPQTAVLGLHSVKERAVVVNGQIVSRPMMYLALTYDHRLLDGREAVTFLKTVKELVEDPRKMLLI
ncbi:dihydrolipoyllysine-residue succinyltransferase component of 2-oxoglutarate dehydrogenase complex, mitochondrial [Trichomonascus vanleenenianus]|uniref:dihydrolipoyllysine-residue succinyltransferase component of 2-oxoglutarate dehydrogenase complex, mitochondrial n=1 Tax=Trichomonascus vanleenenianus TaxID=2268995 RepID=UPI003ECB2C5A